MELDDKLSIYIPAFMKRPAVEDIVRIWQNGIIDTEMCDSVWTFSDSANNFSIVISRYPLRGNDRYQDNTEAMKKRKHLSLFYKEAYRGNILLTAKDTAISGFPAMLINLKDLNVLTDSCFYFSRLDIAHYNTIYSVFIYFKYLPNDYSHEDMAKCVQIYLNDKKTPDPPSDKYLRYIMPRETK